MCLGTHRTQHPIGAASLAAAAAGGGNSSSINTSTNKNTTTGTAQFGGNGGNVASAAPRGVAALAQLNPALQSTLSSLSKSTSSQQPQQAQHQQQQQQYHADHLHQHHHQHAHLIVHHSYHDHSHDPRSEYQEEHPARGGVSTPFPLKLHEMLDAVEGNGHDHIVSWQPHGRCFVVHKPREFVELLPTYFKLSKLASFQRQLNLYGFQRLTRGRDRGAYYHELFLRGRVFMAHSIQRMKVKGTGVRARANPDDEPDFWSMPWIEPLTAAELKEEQQKASSKHKQQQQQQQQQQQHQHQHHRSPSHTTKAPSKPNYMSSSLVMPASLPNTTTSVAPSSFYDSRVLPSSISSIRSVDYYSKNGDSNSGSYQSYMASSSYPSVDKKMPPMTMSSNSNRIEEEDDDIVCAFGNKTFHYLDPFQQQTSSYNKKPAPVYPMSQQEQSLYTKPQPYQQQKLEEDALLSTEAESFFESFDFAPIVDAAISGATTNYNKSSGIEDDSVFGEMLGSLI